MSLTVAPEDAIADATIADEGDGCEEYQTTDGTWLSLQKESNQIEHYEHDMCLH